MPPDSAPPDRSRIHWIDLCKGTMIVLVVLLHATSYFKFKGGSVPAYVQAMTSFVSPMRMPTLIFVSGLMVQVGLRKGPRAFVASRLRTLAWPYLVWCVLWALASGQASKLADPWFWTGDWYLWFLLFILIFSLIAVLIPTRYHLVAAAWSYLAALYAEDGTKYPERLLFFLSVFLAGSWLGRDRERFERLLPSGRTLAALLPAALAVLISSALASTPIRYAPQDAGVIAIVVVATVSVIRLTSMWARFVLLEYIGRHSLVVYLTHMPVIALVLAGLRAAGVDDFYCAFLLSLVAACAASFAAIQLGDRVPLTKALYIWPHRSRNAAPVDRLGDEHGAKIGSVPAARHRD